MKVVFFIVAVFLQSLQAMFSVPVEGKAIELVERAECKDNRDDCDWIANNNHDVPKYCNAHRNDAFIKDCQKTCGFCKQPAPPQVCEDTRSDCSWILENAKNPADYCHEHRDNPEVKKCAKTCGFCKPPAPPKPVSKPPAPPKPVKCEDTRDDCSWIAEHNDDVADYCDRHKNDAFIKQCAKTCGFCKPPAPTKPVSKPPAPPKSVICEDTRSDCAVINHFGENKESYCQRNRNDPEVRKCAKTCGFCKPPAPPKPVKCEDTRDDCSWIAEHNDDVADYCDRHKNDAFIKQCQKTCGFCKPPAPPKPVKCEDTRDDCSWIAEHNDDVADYCDRHKNDAFIKQCQKTCGFCKAPAPPKICENTRSDCDVINHIGENKESYCHRNRNDPAVKQCAKTCGFC